MELGPLTPHSKGPVSILLHWDSVPQGIGVHILTIADGEGHRSLGVKNSGEIATKQDLRLFLRVEQNRGQTRDLGECKGGRSRLGTCVGPKGEVGKGWEQNRGTFSFKASHDVSSLHVVLSLGGPDLAAASGLPMVSMQPATQLTW